MLSKIVFIAFLLLSVFVSPVSAGNVVVNGGFENGDFSGWFGYEAVVSDYQPNTGTYSAFIYDYDNIGDWGYICQDVDLTNVVNLSFYSMNIDSGGLDFQLFIGGSEVSIDYSGYNSYKLHVVDTSSYSGINEIEFRTRDDHDLWIDDVVAIASAASPEFDDVLWDQDPYYTGETANITTNILDFDDGTYSYYLDLYNTNDYLTTYEITSETESNHYTFPLEWGDTSLLAKLQRVTDPYGSNEVNLVMDLSHFETLNWDTTVAFGESSYNPGDTLTVVWSGAPSGSTIWLRAMDDGEKIEVDAAYSGSFNFDVPTNTGETYYLVDVIINGVSQAQASCVINIGDYWTEDLIYIDSYSINKTSFEGQTVTVDKDESTKATVITNINVDFIDVYFYELDQEILTTHTYEINDNVVNVTFPCADNGVWYANIVVNNISTASQNNQYFIFNVGTGSRSIDIYNTKVAAMDTGEVFDIESITGYGGNDLYLPLVRTIMFDVYVDEIINSTAVSSDGLDEGGSNYNFTDDYHLRRSYCFDTPGLHVIEMTVYNDETTSDDYVKWNAYVQGIVQPECNGSVVMYWTKSEIELNDKVLLYFNVSDMDGPVLTIISSSSIGYEITRSLNGDQVGTESVDTGVAGTYKATMTNVNGTVYAVATLTIRDGDDDDPVAVVDDSGGVVGSIRTLVYLVFGESPAGLFIAGVFLVALCAVGFASATQHIAGGIVGAILGLGMVVALGLIPLFWVVLVVIIAGAIVAVTFKGSVG